jgi:Holliday junction resolvase RusA-like endonuclease
VLDALNGVAYEDDSNICGTVAIKKYGEEDEVFIMIEEVGKEDG